MKEKQLSERVEAASAYFKQGYNCSQAVVAAFADLYDFTPRSEKHTSELQSHS